MEILDGIKASVTRRNVLAGTAASVLAGVLADPEQVPKWNAFPYQLMTAYQNASDNIPGSIKVALNSALESSTENVPNLGGNVAVCIDISGSMGSPVTGYRQGSSSVTRCVDVAALMAACMLRKNPDALILGWDTRVFKIDLNPCDSVITNTQKMNLIGGGTDASVALQHLNQAKWKGDTVIYVSDNESWYGKSSYWGGHSGTTMSEEWIKFKRRNKGAKLACIDIQPGDTCQVPDDGSVLNIGGFNDSVFKVIDNFVNNDSRHFSDVVRGVEL